VKPVNYNHNPFNKLIHQLQWITILQVLRNGLDCAFKNYFKMQLTKGGREARKL
jgi:hypothetical protein